MPNLSSKPAKRNTSFQERLRRQAGKRSRRNQTSVRLLFEQLESRNLMAVLSVHNRAADLTLSDGNDVGCLIIDREIGVEIVTGQQKFHIPPDTINQITVHSDAGDDKINIRGSTQLQVSINTGSGTDLVIADTGVENLNVDLGPQSDSDEFTYSSTISSAGYCGNNDTYLVNTAVPTPEPNQKSTLLQSIVLSNDRSDRPDTDIVVDSVGSTSSAIISRSQSDVQVVSSVPPNEEKTEIEECNKLMLNIIPFVKEECLLNFADAEKMRNGIIENNVLGQTIGVPDAGDILPSSEATISSSQLIPIVPEQQYVDAGSIIIAEMKSNLLPAIIIINGTDETLLASSPQSTDSIIKDIDETVIGHLVERGGDLTSTSDLPGSPITVGLEPDGEMLPVDLVVASVQSTLVSSNPNLDFHFHFTQGIPVSGTVTLDEHGSVAIVGGSTTAISTEPGDSVFRFYFDKSLPALDTARFKFDAAGGFDADAFYLKGPKASLDAPNPTFEVQLGSNSWPGPVILTVFQPWEIGPFNVWWFADPSTRNFEGQSVELGGLAGAEFVDIVTHSKVATDIRSLDFYSVLASSTDSSQSLPVVEPQSAESFWAITNAKSAVDDSEPIEASDEAHFHDPPEILSVEAEWSQNDVRVVTSVPENGNRYAIYETISPVFGEPLYYFKQFVSPGIDEVRAGDFGFPSNSTVSYAMFELSNEGHMAVKERQATDTMAGSWNGQTLAEIESIGARRVDTAVAILSLTNGLSTLSPADAEQLRNGKVVSIGEPSSERNNIRRIRNSDAIVFANAAYVNPPSDPDALRRWNGMNTTYEKITGEGIGKWHVITTADLGIDLRDGVFENKNQAVRSWLRENEDGTLDIMISFRGTDDISSADAADWFASNHGIEKLEEFTDAFSEFWRQNDDRISTITVTGHSLGAGDAEAFSRLYLPSDDDRVRVVSIASPGSPRHSPKDDRVIQISSTRDIVAAVGRNTGAAEDEIALLVAGPTGLAGEISGKYTKRILDAMQRTRDSEKPFVQARKEFEILKQEFELEVKAFIRPRMPALLAMFTEAARGRDAIGNFKYPGKTILLDPADSDNRPNGVDEHELGLYWERVKQLEGSGNTTILSDARDLPDTSVVPVPADGNDTNGESLPDDPSTNASDVDNNYNLLPPPPADYDSIPTVAWPHDLIPNHEPIDVGPWFDPSESEIQFDPIEVQMGPGIWFPPFDDPFGDIWLPTAPLEPELIIALPSNREFENLTVDDIFADPSFDPAFDDDWLDPFYDDFWDEPTFYEPAPIIDFGWDWGWDFGWGGFWW